MSADNAASEGRSFLPGSSSLSSLFPGSMPYARRISTSSGVCPADEPGRRGGVRRSDESSFQPNERCAARTTATFGGVSVSSSSSDVASPSESSDTSSTTARRRRLPRVLGKPHLSARLIPSLWRTTVTSGGKGRLGPSRRARFGTRTSSGMGSQSITRADLVSRRRTSLQPNTPRAVRCARSHETLGKTRVAGWAPWKIQILETVSAALVLSRNRGTNVRVWQCDWRAQSILRVRRTSRVFTMPTLKTIGGVK